MTTSITAGMTANIDHLFFANIPPISANPVPF